MGFFAALLPVEGAARHNGQPMGTESAREREHFFGAAKVVAGLTVASRVLGMLRDMAIASLGADRATSAFLVAFQVPNLFRRLFGEGALAGAFVPVFTQTLEESGASKAARLLANTLWLLGVFLLGLMLLIQAGLIAWGLLWPGGWDRQLLIRLTVIMLPFMVTICLLALGSAAMNCGGRFAYPAAAPILLNVFIIAAAWWAAPALAADAADRLYVLAGSVTLAGLVQLAIVLWLLRRLGFSIRPRLRPIEAGIRPILRLLLPMLVGLGFLQVSPFFDSVVIWILSATPQAPSIHLWGYELAKPLTVGAQMHVYTAQRLYQFPMGVLAISLGVAVFPLFSRYASRRDHGALRDSVARALRLSMAEGLAAGTGLFVLAEPITRLLFVRGKFTGADAAASAQVLRMYAVGMWAYCTYQIFARLFFALQRPRVPLISSAALVGVNMALVLALVWAPWLGPQAFGLATALTSTANVLILATLARPWIGGLGGSELARSIARSVLASGAMAAVLELLLWALAGRSSAVIVAAGVPAGAATFVAVLRLLGGTEPGELLGSLRRRTPPVAEGGDVGPVAADSYNEPRQES